VTETKIANPAALGLSGFAATTLVLSLVNAGIVDAGALGAVLALALVYGGGAQLLAGMWEFRSGNTFGATAFTSYGAFWLAIAASGIFKGFAIVGTTGFPYFLLAWTIITGFLTVASVRTNGATVAVFVALFLTFLLLTIGAFQKQAPGVGLTQIGGYLGIVTAIVAWYTAMAVVVTEASGGKIKLPVFPLNA